MKNTILVLILFSYFFGYLPDYSFGRLDPPGLNFSERGGDPFFACTVNGTYEQYNNGRDIATWVPKPPSDIHVVLAANVTGYGKIITQFNYNVRGVSGRVHTNEEKVGDFGISAYVVFYPPYANRIVNEEVGTVSEPISYDYQFTTFDWSATDGSITLIPVEWEYESTVFGLTGKWEKQTPITRPSDEESVSQSGGWKNKINYVCQNCSHKDKLSPTSDFVTCPNKSCREGGLYWNCFGVPDSHALLAPVVTLLLSINVLNILKVVQAAVHNKATMVAVA